MSSRHTFHYSNGLTAVVQGQILYSTEMGKSGCVYLFTDVGVTAETKTSTTGDLPPVTRCSPKRTIFSITRVFLHVSLEFLSVRDNGRE